MSDPEVPGRASACDQFVDITVRGSAASWVLVHRATRPDDRSTVKVLPVRNLRAGDLDTPTIGSPKTRNPGSAFMG